MCMSFDNKNGFSQIMWCDSLSTREQFAIPTPQVPHLWAFLRLNIISERRRRSFLLTMQKGGGENPCATILCGSGCFLRSKKYNLS